MCSQSCTCVRATTSQCAPEEQDDRLLWLVLSWNPDLSLQTTGSREERRFSWAWITKCVEIVHTHGPFVVLIISFCVFLLILLIKSDFLFMISEAVKTPKTTNRVNELFCCYCKALHYTWGPAVNGLSHSWHFEVSQTWLGKFFFFSLPVLSQFSGVSWPIIHSSLSRSLSALHQCFHADPLLSHLYILYTGNSFLDWSVVLYWKITSV